MNPRRKAVVTGAANGIGAAVARRLALTCDVVLMDLDGDALATNAATARVRATGRVETCVLDVLDESAVTSTFARLRSDFGEPDILVNCVGGSSRPSALEALETDAWSATLRLNLSGLFFCSRAVIAGMKQRTWGRIVNFSSLAGRTRSLFGSVAYATAKAGVIGFTRQLAYEVGGSGVTVNVVAPGVTLSERVAQRWDEKPERERAAIVDLIPAHRLATVDEPAAAACFLCSEDAGYINGATMDVNGGLHIG